MDNLKYDDYYEKVLTRLVCEVEYARWALYEIKRGSEIGMVLKNIIVIIGDEITHDVIGKLADRRWLKNRLLSMGFDENLVNQVFVRFANKNISH